jgi:hypothetical protein
LPGVVLGLTTFGVALFGVTVLGATAVFGLGPR